MATVTIDKQALKAKYAEERDKRLRADGSAQYVRLESEFSDLAVDPYTPRKERDPSRVSGRAAGVVAERRGVRCLGHHQRQ